MSQQLWSSPLTGYRRVGTRIAEVSSLVENAITAKTIAEPLQSCPSSADANEMKRHLMEREFDIAGVQATENGPVIGYVETRNLMDGTVADCMTVITPDLLIADSTPLTKVFEVLQPRAFAFVLTGNQIYGLVTRADLNKPPARIYLFGIISLLEMHLTYWTKDVYGETWASSLKPQRLVTAQKIFDLRLQRGHEPTLWECIQFCDKRDLFAKSNRLASLFDIKEMDTYETFFKEVEDIRNCLAHSQNDLCEGSNWGEIIHTIQFCAKFLAWSDEMIESRHADIVKSRSM